MEVDFDALYDHDDNPATDPRVPANYYYDGTLISTYGWDDDPVQLAGIDFWSPAESGPVYIDDVSLTPEPATLALLALGGLAVIRRRKQRVR